MTICATAYEEARSQLLTHPRTWLVTGAAGFIGSHVVDALLRLQQNVVGLDNFATGTKTNLSRVLAALEPPQRERFRFIEGDIRDPAACARSCVGVDVVLHEAALPSVPRSIQEPMKSHDVNVTGFLQIPTTARASGTRRVVYASSSSVYGDNPALPRVEGATGRQLSPYAVGKYADELYAQVFGNCYGLELIGLRYFNVFGPRQDPDGPYSAVIPRWFTALLRGSQVEIFGDGETSRDFCYVANVVQANILASTATRPGAVGQVYNVAFGKRTTLNELYALVRQHVAQIRPEAAHASPVYREFRKGDVRHSLADVSNARRLLGFEPTISVADGLREAATWYAATCGSTPSEISPRSVQGESVWDGQGAQ